MLLYFSRDVAIGKRFDVFVFVDSDGEGIYDHQGSLVQRWSLEDRILHLHFHSGLWLSICVESSS